MACCDDQMAVQVGGCVFLGSFVEQSVRKHNYFSYFYLMNFSSSFIVLVVVNSELSGTAIIA